MNAPDNIKPAATKRSRRAAKQQMPAAELTADQLRLAQLFAALDDKAQASMLRFIAAMVENFPRHKRPALRLVGGGAR
nr:hypothetical protein [uncultured Duganella sp.]